MFEKSGFRNSNQAKVKVKESQQCIKFVKMFTKR